VTESYTDLSPEAAEAVVSEFVDSLSEGRMIDALDLIAMDAVLLDETGHERRGIRAIAKSLLPYREPHAVALETIETAGPEVRVLFRKKKSRLRGSFSVSHGRIRSFRLEPIA
jgi:ketosteroid isomerase-like protein